MRPAAFAWRSLTRQPARAVLGVLGIAAVGALLFDMLLLSRGLVVSFGELLADAGYDVRVTATDALPGLGPEIADVGATVATIRALPEVAEVAALSFGRAELRSPAGDAVPPQLNWIGSGPRAAGSWTLLEGRTLDDQPHGEPPPVLVNRRLAARPGVALGAIVELAALSEARDALPPRRFQVVGVADFHFDAPGELTVATTLAAFAAAQGARERDTAPLVLVASRPEAGTAGAIAALRRARPDLHVFSNDDLVERFRRMEFSYFRQISLVLTTITLFFAFILVATLLTVSVNQRFGEVAGLRAIGFPRRRVVADLLWESGLLVAAGGALAVPLGLALAQVLERILHDIPVPERLRFFAFEPRAALLYVTLLALTALLAAAYPVWLVARLPIARTLRDEVVS